MWIANARIRTAAAFAIFASLSPLGYIAKASSDGLFWTTADADKVAAVGISVAKSNSDPAQIGVQQMWLMQLADCFTMARNNEAAKRVMLYAESLLSSPTDKSSSPGSGSLIDRGLIAEKFVQIGDSQDARKFFKGVKNPDDLTFIERSFLAGQTLHGCVSLLRNRYCEPVEDRSKTLPTGFENAPAELAEIKALKQLAEIAAAESRSVDLDGGVTGGVDPVLDKARTLAQSGNLIAARSVAVQDAMMEFKVQYEPALQNPAYAWQGHLSRLADLSVFLFSIGAVDEAITVAEPISVDMRGQYYCDDIQAEIQAGNRRAVDHLLPFAMADLAVTDPNSTLFQELIPLTTALNESGMTQEGRQVYQLALIDKRKTTGWIPQFVQAQVANGDLAGALATIFQDSKSSNEIAGKLASAIVTMSFDDPSREPDPAVFSSRLAKVQSMLPKSTDMVKQNEIMDVVEELANMRQIQKAITVEALMEGKSSDPLHAISGYRDSAISAIAIAQAENGDPYGASFTIARIRDPQAKWNALFALAYVPVTR